MMLKHYKRSLYYILLKNVCKCMIIFISNKYVIICIFKIAYMSSANSHRYTEKTIDLTVGNNYWHASLNIDLQYEVS